MGASKKVEGREEFMADDVRFLAGSGASVHGVMAYPIGGAKVPGLVLIQEWHGVNGYIRSMVDRFASKGFVVLAPDLYDGTVATDNETAGKLMSELHWPTVIDKIAGAVKYLGADPRTHGKVGVVGFCMGGAATLLAAASVQGVSAVVPFYGIPPAGAVDWKALRVPIQGHYATVDNWVKPEMIAAASAEVNAHGGSFELHMYEANHAFMRDTDPAVYNAAASAVAWDRAVSFLHKHLR